MTSIGQKVKKISKNVFRTLCMSEVTHTNFRRDIGLFSFQELKKSDTERTPTNLKESGTTAQMF